MKIGITLPQFRDDAEPAFEVARHAEAAGLDGVFVFDHLWPIGRPDRPALHGPTLLAALAAETERVVLGSLVARVGLVPDAVLIHQFATLHRILGSRLIAGLGTGDHLSRVENDAYRVAFAPAPVRRAAMGDICQRLRSIGVATWVGGRSPATRAVGRAGAGAVNLWEAGVEDVTAEAARQECDVTWGGQVDLSPGSGTEVAARLAALAGAGAAWTVVAPVTDDWHAAVRVLAAILG
ncbi:MAG: LLM class flavin-dependent oxidoreductase [Acidimicrobiales bacterium]